MPPSKPIAPTAPPYQRRGVASWSSMNCMAQILGAPVTVTAHMWVRNASSASNPVCSRPSTWSTVWISRLYISICRRPMTLTVPGTQTRDLSLRSTSVHMVSSDSSLAESSSVRMFSASSSGPAPRAIVPEIGQVSDPVPGDPHVHLGRRADQVLPLAQVEHELVRRRVALPQLLVERRRPRAAAVEHVPGHHLEQVTAGELLPRLRHDLGVGARAWAARAGRRAAAGQAAWCARSAAAAPAVETPSTVNS